MFDLADLMPHQVDGLDALAARAILGDAAGGGKTVTSLVWADGVSDPVYGKVLVLATGEEIMEQWLAQAELWTPRPYVKGWGTKAKRETARRDTALEAGGLVLNYEAMWRDVDALIEVGFDTIICDEAHHLKNRTSATYKALDKLARRSTNLLLVTGTPILNHAEELWSMLHLIDPARWSSFWRWAKEHFDIEVTDFHGTAPSPIRLVKGLKPGHEDVLRAELHEFLLARDYDTIFPGTPTPILHEVNVQLSEAEREHYNELVRRSWTRVGDELIVTENAVAKTTRLRQLTSSWAAFDEDAEHPGAKVQAAVELVGRLKDADKILVLSAYQSTAERVTAELNKVALMGLAATIHGNTPKRERRGVLAKFKEGGIRVLSATIGVLGEGVDGLQVADTLIQLDRDWTPARNEQVLARLRRGGKTRQVTAFYIVADRTVDEAVSRALSSKTEIIQSLL